jgi:hypothetical protein
VANVIPVGTETLQPVSIKLLPGIQVSDGSAVDLKSLKLLGPGDIALEDIGTGGG